MARQFDFYGRIRRHFGGHLNCAGLFLAFYTHTTLTSAQHLTCFLSRELSKQRLGTCASRSAKYKSCFVEVILLVLFSI